MRERTPSADDTPKRAPPAPPGEADVAVRKATDVASAAACGASKMVASTHSLDDLGVSHLGSSASQQQPPSSAQHHHLLHHHSHHHHPHHHHYHPAHHHHHHHLQQPSGQSGKSSQSTQDKRSRLSNVINNLRKKVPPEASIKRDCPSSAALGKPGPIEDGSPDSARSSLETLERYMMTVLSGVIEPEEEKRPIAGKKEQPEPPAAAKAANELKAESNGPKDPNDPDGAAAAPATAPAAQDDKPDRLEPAEASDLDAAVPRPLDGPKLDDAAVKGPAASSTAASDGPSEPTDSPDAEATEEAPRSLGDIILDRLTEHRQEPEQLARKDRDGEARAVCAELLDRLLEEALKASLDRQTETTTPEEPSAADGSTQSLHCSLPLDKVASVLPSCQTSPTPTTTTTAVTQQQPASSPGASPPKVSVGAGGTVRHLCLYCERKFPSLTLRQRHTERVHQVSLTRRSSERTARKSSQQSCQYCVDKCTDNLEALFQHLVGSHSDKYHGCLECSTRYQSKDALTSHIHEIHSQLGLPMDKLKEPILLPASLPAHLEPKASAATPASAAVKLVVKEEPPPAPSDSHEQSSSSSGSGTTSAEFDAFYSTVSCNIRENLLHHLDGKLHKSEPSPAAASSISPPLGALAASFDLKPTVYQQQQPQQQLPIDISLTAVTPVYSKQAADPEDFGNSSEQAGKPGKSSLRSHPHRRVSFEKYNFPRKYDSKQQWTCSIKDLSRFDISTQLSLRNKQKLAESSAAAGEMTSLKESHGEHQEEKLERKEGEKEEESKDSGLVGEAVRVNGEEAKDAEKCAVEVGPAEQEATVFSSDFDNFMRLKKCANSVEQRESQERLVYAELTGEWSRPRVYVCGACADRFVTLRDLEEHKSLAHPNVWCMHFEFAGEQRELYKHLVFLPTAQRSASPIFGVSSIKTRQQTTAERVCTKCSKVCASLADLHRHMLECAGDQAWLLGLFGNGKKKCKWRPFGSRSRRRRQRGMKRNIQNSQTQPRNYVPRERPQHTGPRVRPSDRESIQKMLANLPAKRATRKVLQENAMVRSQGRLRSAQSRGGAPDNPASLMVKSKAVLRNKLLKNAKSYQRKKNLREEKEARVSGEARGSSSSSNSPSSQSATAQPSANKGGRLLRNLRVLGKRRNVRSTSLVDQPAAGLRRRIELRSATRQNVLADEPSSPEPVRRRTLLAKPPNKRPDESPAVELLQPRKRRKKGRRLLAESRLSPSSSSGLPSASTKTPKQQQPRGNDGKFATSSLRQRAQAGRAEPPGRLLTRSKLRAAAKLAWQEHTRISRRVTRLASLDLAEKSSREISSEPAELDETAAQSANATDEQPNEPVEQTKPKRTFSRNSSTSRRSLDGLASLEDSGKPETNAALPALGLRGRRPKKDLPSPNVTADDLPLVVIEPANELILTRSQRSLSSSLGSKAESKTRRSLVTSREAKELALSPLELPKKSAKSPDVADAAATATCAAVDSVADKSGLRTRSNSRAKKETKESVVDIIARKIAMEITERKTSKRGQKDVSDKRDKSLIVDKSIDSEIEVASSSKKVGLPSALKKSLRNKEPELKEGVEEVPKIENSCKPTVGDVAKTAEILVTNSPLNKEEDKQLDSTESVSKKVTTGRRRGRAKRNVVVVEDTAEEPEETPAVSEEAPVQEPLIELPKDTICVPESPIVDLEDKSSQAEDSLITEPKENIVSNGLQPNIEHLQHESSNSNMDSGKENSADTVVISPKSKLTRPRKTRVLRKDGKPTQTSGKRSLSSVIGILTEAVNVPVLEEPTTTVLTVQTSFDNPTAEHACQSSELNVAVLESTDVGEKSTEQSPVSANSSVEEKPVSEDVAKEVVKEAVKEADQPKKPEEKETAAADKKEETVPAEPATDIILDLSRRKPKGKGSFLEKIVSKIAKQKDVSLEVDSVSRAQRNQDDAEKTKSQECTKPVEPSVSNVVAAPSEQPKSSEPVVATINVEASVESSQTAEDTSSAKLNEATSVNSVNNAKALAVEDVAEIKEPSLCSIDSKVHESAVGNEVKSDDKDTSEEIKKDDDDRSVFNCAIDNVDKPEKLAEEVKEDAVPEDKPEEKKNLKKRSLEVSLPRSSKKKPVDNDNSELEERDEICLADIMKLIDRSTAKEKTEESSVESEVKPGKRKSPEDDMEFKVDENSSKTTADCSRENEEKTTKKAKRKGAQKKNKREAFKLANDNDENSEKEAAAVAVKHNSDISVIESTLTDCSVDVKLTNDSNDIADNEVSAINLGPIVDRLEEHKIPDSKESVDETCSNARQSVELSKTSDEESLNVNVLDVQSLISEEDKTDEKVTKRKMRSRKRNSDIEKEIEPQIVNDEKSEDNSIKSDVEDSSIDAQDESFKVPEVTKVTKSSKKRNSRSKSKKSIEPRVCVEENDIELGDDVVQKQRTSKRNALRLNSKYLELEESVEKNEATAEDDAVQKQRTLRSKVKKHVEIEGFVEKNDAQDDEDDNVQKQRSSNRRSLRSKQKQIIDEQNSSESEDVAASNRSTPKRHTRSSSSSNNIEEVLTSSRMSEDLDTTADESTSIVNINESKDATVNNESVEEDKPEKRQFRERKAKKTVTLSEKVEVFGDGEAVTETKHKASEPSAIVAEPMSVEKEAVSDDKEPNTIEEPREVEVATPAEVVKGEAEAVEQDQPQVKISEPERTTDLEEKDQISDQPLNSPDSPSSSIDDTDNKSPIAQEVASSSETEEQSSSSELTGPKKRALGNFSVVNKSGKILIVEKKKKLTKEAAKFFCSLCATSFTRKSSLKKHNLSQSHVLQVTMNSSKGVVKDVTEEQTESDTKDEEQKSNWDEEEKEEKIEQEKGEDDSTVVKETQVAEPMLLAPESSVEQITDPVQPIPKPIEPTKILTPVPEFFHTTTTPTLPELSFLAHKSPEQLEDEMLDEEICKITENMSHDEYVLTDHVSPITPEAASTPIRKVTFVEKESSPVVAAAKRKKEKKEKKKKNLADEHLSLDTPVPVTETPTNANVNDSVTINDKLEDSAIVDQRDNICQSEDSKVSEADSTFEQVRSDKKDVKSKVNLEEKIDDTRRTTRNRNQIGEQNVSVAWTDNHARPKRNQLRPSYKEDENFDFEIESLGNRSEEELKSKIPKMNISTGEIQGSEGNVNKLKDNAKVQSSKDHASIAEIDTSVSDKEILSEKKIKGRKSKRRAELENTTNVSLDLESKENIKIDEDNDNTISLEKSETENLISVSKEESIVEADNLDESQTTGTGKKKRGRKSKKASGEMDKTMDEQLDTINLADETEKEQRIVEKLASPRLGKTTKNQNKKPKITDAFTPDESTTNNVDQVSSHDHTSSKHERKPDEIKSYPKKEPTAIFLSADAAKVHKSPTESKNCPDSQQHLVFPSLSSDNFKPFTEPKSDLVASNLGGFDSDDNSDIDTNMSVKIQKLLDDPEMTSEIGSKRTDEDSPAKDVMSRIEPVDVLNVAEPLTNKSPASITPIPAIASVEAPPAEAEIRPSTERAKKSPRSVKSTGAKAKRRSRKSKSSGSCSKASSSEESEPEQAKLPSSKNKIVKCVFGRVFAGNEKPDKVKEVLDDWQSRSDNDSPSEEEEDSEADSAKSQQARKSRSRTRKAQLRANGPEASRKSSGRQSKRRAEELISKAFDEDLGRTDQTGRSAKKLGKRTQNDSVSLGDKQEIPSNDEEFNEEATVSAKSKKAKRKKEEQETKQLNEELDEEVADNAKTQTDSNYGDVEKVENEEEQQEEVELSSRDYQQRNASSGIEEGKDRSSASEDEKERQSKQRSRKSHKKKSSSRRGEQSSVDGGRREATTGYAPSDALEDNALDVDAARSQTRLTKVLNFDEELFVECCSRLKASEKELRATKKIKLDQSAEELIQANPSTIYHHHHHHHHKRDEQHAAGYRATKDRWRDVESQNNLGSLLESVNQLLGEEYNSREREYSSSSSTKRSRNHHHHHHHHHHHNHHHRSSGHHHHHNHHHHHHNRYNNSSSSTGNPNGRSSPEDNVTPSRPSDYFEPGYDDSLDVAFEHNNKLRDKIQRRMRESESLIATSFGQHTKSQSGSPAAATEAAVAYEPGYGNLDAGKAKINNGFGGLVDKALSNLLHSNEKHDHNGSTPMKLLAELACARAPSVTTPTVPEKPAKLSPKHDKDLEVPITEPKKPQPEHESKPVAASKKSKNPIKELFERKKEMQEKRQQQQQQLAKTERSRKQKKTKSGSQHHNLPLIRTGQYRGGMAERKRRRGDSAKKKDLSHVDGSKIKDVYDFDEEEEEAKVETGVNNTVLSYRAKPETPGREFSMSALLSKAIGDVLSNGKSVTAMTENLENMIDREFQDIENYEKPARKATKDDDKQESVIGPMDEYVERKQKSSKRTPIGEVVMAKHSSKSKKKSVKSGKKKSRNAWYENDSSDEFVTRLKTDDIAGVGINKSQRTCSKGKQNLFAEMSSTSSESEFELEDAGVDDVDGCKDVKKHLIAEKNVDETAKRQTKGKNSISDDEFQNGESQEVWSGRENNSENVNNELPYRDLESNKKSESELSDHPLVIDENQKEPTDLEQRTNSDDETEGLVLDLDDLYREDSSIIDSDRDELSIVTSEDKLTPQAKTSDGTVRDKQSNADKYISVEDALELLDRPQEVGKKPRTPAKMSSTEKPRKSNKRNIDSQEEDMEEEEEEETGDSRAADLPEKLSGNEKPKRESENLPLHVFLSRKVQESKKRKQQELKRLREEQERMLLELQPTRRQRKCAIGKQGLLAEISSSDEEPSSSSIAQTSGGEKSVEGHERSRIAGKQRQRESKEKRKERYIEKKHEQMIAKEQKAIEEAILRELEEKRLSAASEASGSERDENNKQTGQRQLDCASESEEQRTASRQENKARRHKQQSCQQEPTPAELDSVADSQIKRPKSTARTNTDNENDEAEGDEVIVPDAVATPVKKRRATSKSPQKSSKKSAQSVAETRKAAKRATPGAAQRRSKNRTSSVNRSRELKEQSAKSSDLDGDEELKATKSWKKVDEAVGVAIGRRKRAAANQLYYWSSSSDEEDEELAETESPKALEQPTGAANGSSQENGQEDERQEQHGWIVGDSHKRMITMLAMEKQMKEKRRRSENDEQQSVVGGANNATPVAPAISPASKACKTKKHRNSTS